MRHARLVARTVVVLAALAAPLPAHAGPMLRIDDPRSPIVDTVRVSRNGRLIVWRGGAVGQGSQVYGYDTRTRRVELLSVSRSGTPGNGEAAPNAVSADGRYVVFSALAGNLVPGDTNGLSDVFVRDRIARTTTRVSVTARGWQLLDASSSGTISDDGSTVAFITCSADGVCAAQVRPRASGKRVTPIVTAVRGDLDTFAHPWNSVDQLALSATGRYLAFRTKMTLTPDDHRVDGCGADVYLRDLRTTQVTLLTGDLDAGSTCALGSTDAELSDRFWAPVLDPAGHCAAVFQHLGRGARPLRLWFRDLRTGVGRLVTATAGGTRAVVTADCARVYFLSDSRASDAGLADAGNGGCGRVYAWDVASGTATRVSPDVPGGAGSTLCGTYAAGNGDLSGGQLPRTRYFGISDDGRTLALVTSAAYDPADTDRADDLYLRMT
jgi:hypothetical protein